MTRVSDNERDVYGYWVVAIVNATRIAQRSERLMSEGEATIVQAVKDALLALDPAAEHVVRAQINTVPRP